MKKNFFICCKLFFLFYTAFCLSVKQITTDSYADLEEICDGASLIVIDLLDVGIEYVEPLLHSENKKLLNSNLREILVASFKIREYIKCLESNGFIEIDNFLVFYKKINSKSILLITDRFYYVPSFNFYLMNLNYDSYKDGVLFYRNDFWLDVIKKISVNYKKIIFISNSKNKVKKFLACFNSSGVGVLFVCSRVPLKGFEVKKLLSLRT